MCWGGEGQGRTCVGKLSGVAPETAMLAFAAFQSMRAVHVGVTCWSQLLVPVAYIHV